MKKTLTVCESVFSTWWKHTRVLHIRRLKILINSIFAARKGITKIKITSVQEQSY